MILPLNDSMSQGCLSEVETNSENENFLNSRYHSNNLNKEFGNITCLHNNYLTNNRRTTNCDIGGKKSRRNRTTFSNKQLEEMEMV